MNTYEITLVLPEKATPAKKKQTKELVVKLINAMDGKILKDEDWGKKNLAQKINDEEVGQFMYFVVELASNMVSQVDTKLKLEEGIIRHLIIKI